MKEEQKEELCSQLPELLFGSHVNCIIGFGLSNRGNQKQRQKSRLLIGECLEQLGQYRT